MKPTKLFSPLALFFVLTCFIISCNNDDGQSSNNGIDLVEIDQAISIIDNTIETSKVVISYEIEGDHYVLRFSDNSTPLRIATSIVDEIIGDEDAWKLEITFTNDQKANLFLKGTTIGINASNIELDPNDRTPLAALATFATPLNGNIKVVVSGKGESGIPISKTFDRKTTAYEIPILGLYQDYTNPVEFHFLDISGNLLSKDIVEITTQKLEDPIDFEILINKLPATEDKVYMEVGLKQAFDQQGEIRWAYVNDAGMAFYQRLPNGNWMVSNSEGRVRYYWPKFSEIDMLGNVIKTYEIPNLGHHEIRVIDNGQSFLVASNSTKILPDGSTQGIIEDTVLEISATTGTIIRTIDYNQLLDPNRTQLVEATNDWFHINSVDLDIGIDGLYGTEDDGVITSGRHQAAVVKTNRLSGNVEWILGSHELWNEDLQKYLLTPVDASGAEIDITDINFWPYGQHTATILPNRNILMYDNGNLRGFYKEDPKAQNQYTRVVEYKIDEENMTIEKVWEFDYDKKIYTPATGEVEFLPDTKGKLISFLWENALDIITPRVVELDENDTVVFEYIYNSGAVLYRSDKFDLYENME